MCQIVGCTKNNSFTCQIVGCKKKNNNIMFQIVGCKKEFSCVRIVGWQIEKFTIASVCDDGHSQQGS